MGFATPEFLGFPAVVGLLYAASPRRFRSPHVAPPALLGIPSASLRLPLLLVTSILFYVQWSGLTFTLLLLGTTLLTFFAARVTRRWIASPTGWDYGVTVLAVFFTVTFLMTSTRESTPFLYEIF